VGQRLDNRGVNREDRGEEVGEVNALCSDASRNRAPSASKLQGCPFLDDFAVRFPVAVEQLVADLAHFFAWRDGGDMG
jgi:hypothetical protein